MNSLGRTLLALSLSGSMTSCDFTPPNENSELVDLATREAALNQLIEQEKQEELASCRSNLSTLLQAVTSCHDTADQAHQLAYPNSKFDNHNTHISTHIDPARVERLSLCQQNTRTALFDLEACLTGVEHMVDFALEE